MFRAHPVILLSAVLKIVSVPVLRELLPFDSHPGRGGHEIVFRPEVVGIVGIIDSPDIIQKVFEQFPFPILIKLSSPGSSVSSRVGNRVGAD